MSVQTNAFALLYILIAFVTPKVSDPGATGLGKGRSLRIRTTPSQMQLTLACL